MHHLEHSFFVSSHRIDLPVDGFGCTQVGDYFVGSAPARMSIAPNSTDISISLETVETFARATPGLQNTVSIRDNVLTVRGSDMNTQSIYYLFDTTSSQFVVFNDLFLSRLLLDRLGRPIRYRPQLAGDLTFFEGVNRLRFGEQLTVTATRNALEIRKSRFSDILRDDGDRYRTVQEAKDALFERLDLAVKEMVAGRPVVNIALSGGVDSGTIAYLIRRYDVHLKAYTVTTDWGDEYREAKETADSLGIGLETIHVRTEDILSEIGNVIRFYYFTAPESIEIALVAHCLYTRLLAGDPSPKVFLTGYGSDLLNAGVFAPFQDYRELDAEILARLRRTQLSNEFSSLSALSCRVRAHHPFWNSDVIGCALRVPSHFKVVDGQDKYYFREMMSTRLPAAIVWRRKCAAHHGTGLSTGLSGVFDGRRTGSSDAASRYARMINQLHEDIFARGRYAVPVAAG
jgi:asparagine synthetase B (glutamine-hydrolysing)